MITAKTLVGLACLISNKGPLDTSSIEAQLTPTEKTKVQAIIDTGICLPESLEMLIRQTKDGIEKGELIQVSSKDQPCVGCVK